MRLKGHYIPVVLVAENEKFYKEAFEVFAYNYLVKPVESGELEHVLEHILRYAGVKTEEHCISLQDTGLYTAARSSGVYIQ